MSNGTKARRGPVATLGRDNPAGSTGLNRATLPGDVDRCNGYQSEGEWRALEAKLQRRERKQGTGTHNAKAKRP